MERVFSTPSRRPRTSITNYNSALSYSRSHSARIQSLHFGDNIHVRVAMGGRIVKEFMTNRVADLTELLGEVRYHTNGLSGLAHINIRNASRGWNLERPLMLYANFPTPRTAHRHQPVQAHMTFPYETH